MWWNHHVFFERSGRFVLWGSFVPLLVELWVKNYLNVYSVHLLEAVGWCTNLTRFSLFSFTLVPAAMDDTTYLRPKRDGFLQLLVFTGAAPLYNTWGYQFPKL